MNWHILTGKRVQLGAMDHDKDAKIESGWTHELAYMRVVTPDLPRPLSASQMKKRYENLEKRMGENGDTVYFTIRSLEENRLLGFLHLEWIGWSNSVGSIQIALAATERNNGFGSEALQLALTYAFEELNLYRVSATIAADNPGALRFFERAGFQVELRLREAVFQNGQRWDQLGLGLIHSEWVAHHQEENDENS